jgi:mono/diheme cytochrome c family protein
MTKRSLGLFSLMVLALFVISACAQELQPTATAVTFSPTKATGAAPQATASSGGSSEPAATATTAPAADPAVGQTVFAGNCAACHSVTDQQIVGPGLGGVATRAATREAGLSAEEYITKSIKDPNSFVVEGFAPIMPALTNLSDGDVQNLVAYLMTLQ